ncbi:MAG: recombinase family protein [Terriglobales bacterium]
MKIAIYCRVSTRDKGQEAVNQRLQLERFARKQGWMVQGVYEDRVSGKRGDPYAMSLARVPSSYLR